MAKFDYKKKFGQNFITDKNLLSDIAELATLESGDTVVEVGTGMGTLTEEIAKRAKNVVTFEIDEDLREILTEKFSDSNVRVIFGDVLNFDGEKFDSIVGEKFKLVANLPYYITSPLLIKFLKNKNLLSATVMVQEEVAERITAKPHSSEYGVLSVICQLFGDAKIVKRVGRRNFFPVPSVDSAVVHIERGAHCDDLNKFDGLIEFVKTAFRMKRKKLSTNLQSKNLSKEHIEAKLRELNLSESARAEELSIREFMLLYDEFRDKI